MRSIAELEALLIEISVLLTDKGCEELSDFMKGLRKCFCMGFSVKESVKIIGLTYSTGFNLEDIFSLVCHRKLDKVAIESILNSSLFQKGSLH